MSGIVKQNIRNRIAWKQEQVHTTMKHHKEQKKTKEAIEKLKWVCDSIKLALERTKEILIKAGTAIRVGMKNVVLYLKAHEAEIKAQYPQYFNENYVVASAYSCGNGNSNWDEADPIKDIKEFK